MRLDYLRLPKHRNLLGFEIYFDESQATTVLLGRNGSGKSNLIETIVEIFRELDAGRHNEFPYHLRYTCRNHKIEVECNPALSRGRLQIRVDDQHLSLMEFNRQKDAFLPPYVFAYYSGWSNRLERLFDGPTRRYYNQLLNNADDDMPLRRFFFCRKEYSQLVLLAFFLADDPAANKLLEDYLGIKAFESALFVLKRPWWGAKKRSLFQAEETDQRFWNARGAFRPFLNRLWQKSFAPIRNDETVEHDVRRIGETTEHLYLFIKDLQHLSSLRAEYETPKLFFSNLEGLFLCDLIDEIRINVLKKDGSRVRFSQLSEGEQQLLTVLGLIRFTQDDESLYLLDEPDTHLNPVWTYNYLTLLQENIRAERGQLIITTHNPLMIGTLTKNQVRVISQQEEATVTEEPEYDPIGIGVEGLLKSELYGLRSTLAPEILIRLDRQYALLGKRDKTPEEQLELINLGNELNSLGITRTHPNPYFELFATAMARLTPTPSTVLSMHEIEEQTALADRILSELLSDEMATREESQS